MASEANGRAVRSPWRIIGWGVAVALLIAPFVAMQFTREVNWTASDFMVFGVMLLAVGIPIELAAWHSGNRTYLGAASLALLGAFLVTWANLAVGIVDTEENPPKQPLLRRASHRSSVRRNRPLPGTGDLESDGRHCLRSRRGFRNCRCQSH